MTTLAEAADDIPFAVFSALTHSHGPEARDILKALADALDTIDTEPPISSWSAPRPVWAARLASGYGRY